MVEVYITQVCHHTRLALYPYCVCFPINMMLMCEHWSRLGYGGSTLWMLKVLGGKTEFCDAAGDGGAPGWGRRQGHWRRVRNRLSNTRSLVEARFAARNSVLVRAVTVSTILEGRISLVATSVEVVHSLRGVPRRRQQGDDRRVCISCRGSSCSHACPLRRGAR